MKTSRLLCLAFGYLFAFCLTPTSVYAAVDVSYDPILPLCINVFSDPNCWVGGVVPGTSDNAIFNTAAVAPYTVNFTAAASNDNTIVHTDNLILDLGTNTYSLTTDLTVGELMGDVANLSITDGTVSDQSGHIGLDRGSTGTVTVDGIGSTWNNNLLEIGIHGNGTLTVKNEGVVTSSVSYLSAAGNPGAIGTATVDGAGSLWNSGGLQV